MYKDIISNMDNGTVTAPTSRGVDPVLKVGGGEEDQFIYTYMYA